MLPGRSERKAFDVATLSLLAQSSNPQGGNPLYSLLPVLLLGVLFYFVLIRPQRAQRQRQQRLLSALEVGDEVLTIGGMYGTIVEIDDEDDTVTVQVAPGTRIRMLRRAISQRLTSDDEEYDEAEGETPDEEAEPRP
jgi:preprotein translocase subunit YajC